MNTDDNNGILYCGMKKILFSAIILLFMLRLFTLDCGCVSSIAKEQFISEGVYINDGVKIYNQVLLDNFYRRVFAGNPAFIRTMAYTIEGDPIITDYVYDGKIFTVKTDISRDRFSSTERRKNFITETYKYLVPLDRARIGRGILRPYFLSNDANIYKDAEEGGITLIDGLLGIPSPSRGVAPSGIEKGYPAATYSRDKILLPNGNEAIMDVSQILLFVNGTIITDYEVIIRNDRALVPVRFIAEHLGASVEWDGKSHTVTLSDSISKIVLTIDKTSALVNNKETVLDHPAILYKNLAYAPLRLVAENLNATVHYEPPQPPEYAYYYDTRMPVSPAGGIIRDFPNILIDEKYPFDDAKTVQKTMGNAKAICLEGLENFSLRLKENLARSNEDPGRFDGDLENIKAQINRMLYIGEVSRFYKFTIGPYDILYDRINDRMFFIIYSSATIVKEVNIYDAGLYMPVFIAG